MGHGYSSRGYGYSQPGMRNPRHTTWSRSNEGDDIRDPDTETEERVIKVISIDMKIKENAYDHNTSKYDITDPDSDVRKEDLRLVVRRGEPFDIEITFNRSFNREKDDLRLIFDYGKEPMQKNATHIEIIISDKDEPKAWGARIRDSDDEKLKVRIQTPPTLYVGKWTFNVDVIEKGEEKNIIYRHKKSKEVYILFNPWCKDDAVYMDDDKRSGLREEYVLNDGGKIWKSLDSRRNGKSWNFAQFDAPVLECALYLLDLEKFGLPDIQRGNPILTTRKLSALVSSPDNNGILVGNWSGDYEGGTGPTSWNGSYKIIEQYFKNKKPVKYGQCWVFSGVLTTICRTLGIPARSVTNFNSAHDTNGSITIDKYLNEKGDKDEWRTNDSVWNFHVWNDAWMSRPDLPEGYGGWQAIDATPQETSAGVFQCGPMSVRAIREGYVDLPYDGPFIFAEVNADIMHYTVYKDGKIRKSKIDKAKVGKNLSTKLPNSYRREDVTREYKYREGSSAERKSVITANLMGSEVSPVYDTEDQNEVNFVVNVKPEEVNYGENFEVVVTIENKSKETKYLDGFINAETVNYIGLTHTQVRHDERKETIEPGKTIELKMTVTFDEYYDKLVEQCMLEMSAFFKVPRTMQMWQDEIQITLVKPPLDIKMPEKVQVTEKVTVEVSFKNPIQRKLTKCILQWESPGLVHPQSTAQRDVDINETFVSTFEFEAKRSGEHEVIVSFDATEILEVNGSAMLRVENSHDNV